MNIAVSGNIVFDCTVYSDGFLKEGERNNFDNVNFNTGGPASTAASVIAKGKDMHVDFYGQVGCDPTGDIVYNEMLKEGINMDHVHRSKKVMTPFGFVLINRSNGGERTICSIRSPKDFVRPKIEKVSFDNKYDYILTDGKYAYDSMELIDKNRDAISIIDADRVNPRMLKLCDKINYIICSEKFANLVTGLKLTGDYDNDIKVYKELKKRFKNAFGLTITVGPRGYICEKDKEIVIEPAFEPDKPTIDTNGAGDIFHGAFTYAMASNYDYHRSLDFANVTASLSTTKHGGRKSCPSLNTVTKIVGGPTLTRKR